MQKVNLSPYCILKSLNKKDEFSGEMIPGSILAINNESVYVTSEVFMDWVRNNFTPRYLLTKPFFFTGNDIRC
jgi:hypothetical protein